MFVNAPLPKNAEFSISVVPSGMIQTPSFISYFAIILKFSEFIYFILYNNLLKKLKWVLKIKKTTRQASLLVFRCLLKYLMIKIRLNQNTPLQHHDFQHRGGVICIILYLIDCVFIVLAILNIIFDYCNKQDYIFLGNYKLHNTYS